MNMLTPDDLKAIESALAPRFDGLETRLTDKINTLEETMNIKLDAMLEIVEDTQKETGIVRNQMVTKDYLDRKLTAYVQKKPA